MSPILVTLTSRIDSNFQRLNISFKENIRDVVDLDPKGAVIRDLKQLGRD